MMQKDESHPLSEWADCDEHSLMRNLTQIQRFHEIFKQFDQSFSKINSSRMTGISAYAEIYSQQRAECRGYVCQQLQGYKLVLHECLDESTSE